MQLQLQLLTRGEGRCDTRSAAMRCLCLCLSVAGAFFVLLGKHWLRTCMTFSRRLGPSGLASEWERRANERAIGEVGLEWTAASCLAVSCQRCMKSGTDLAASQMAMFLEGFCGTVVSVQYCCYVFRY